MGRLSELTLEGVWVLGAGGGWEDVVVGLREAVSDPVRDWETLALVVGVPVLVVLCVWLNVRVAGWLMRRFQKA